MIVIRCNGSDLPTFTNAQIVSPHTGLFPYAHEVNYICYIGGHRFEDGDMTTTVTCSATGWTWNYIVTSCERTFIRYCYVLARIIKCNYSSYASMCAYYLFAAGYDIVTAALKVFYDPCLRFIGRHVHNFLLIDTKLDAHKLCHKRQN